MRKNTSSQTATTFTVCLSWTPEQREGITGTHVWKSAEDAREAMGLMSREIGHTVHFAPGLEVHAFYAYGDIVTIIAFEDDTAARLHTAVRKAQPVTVTYVKADGEETVRTIEPTRLSLTKAGDVLIKAADRASGEKRSFRLDRILTYTLHRTAFLVRSEKPAPSKAELVAAFQARTYTVEYRDLREGERVLYEADSEGEAAFVKAAARQDAHLELIHASF